MPQQPLILTLELDPASFLFFEDLRRQHFPADRNFLQAHLTLFHNLPPGEPEVFQELVRLSAATPVIDLHVAGVVSIGKGVAFKIESTMLQSLHKGLQQAWKPWLIPQDQQKLWPHVTVQNKVSPLQAKELHSQLAQGFRPFGAQGLALRLWIYKDGPWEALQRFEFRDQ